MTHLEREKRINDFWKRGKIFEKSVNQKSPNSQYVFYDGPPFATGTPHYGHILGLTSKDVFPRYWTMKGFRCERRWGWDCHGLPIENIAESELKIKEKKEVYKYGVKEFNSFCRSKVLFFASEWKKVVDRMGKWIDFDDSYKTMDTDYMETIWWIFKKLYNDKLVYEGKRILMYCPRCETPVAKAEIAMDKSYKDVTEKTATVKFKLKSSACLLAWTTTPWTLIGNVALAVNPKIDYVKIKIGKEVLILAKDRLGMISDKYSVVETFKGNKLLNLKYEPLYNLGSEKDYIIIDGGEQVSSEEGTGIVHMALYGEFDFEMISKYKLSEVQHLNNSGKLVKGPDEWLGTWFKKLDPLVVKDLEDRGLLFESKSHTHSYPFCYRCNTPLVYNAVDSWFINIQKVKKELIKKAELINWYPSNIKDGIFKNILETAPDWTISRNRFWATALPVWRCEHCKSIEVIGSIEELEKKSVSRIKGNIDLHKDFVDNIKFKCSKCSGTMNRVPEVIDCWFESGSMPYAAKHYPFENKDWFVSNYPADFVSEYIAQTRAWYYYMHVIGVLVLGKPPFRNVVVTGNILAEDGAKMSKSKKNYPDPLLMFDKYGADAVRFYLMNSAVMRGQDIRFKEDGLNEVYRRVLLLVENVASFYFMFAGKKNDLNNTGSGNILDKWIISRLNELIKGVSIEFEDYNTLKICEQLMEFIDELSTWYVRRSRDRFKNNDKEAVNTLGYVLLNLVKLLSPITPFIAEDVYQRLKVNNTHLLESVHLDSWPVSSELLIDSVINGLMKTTRAVASKALEERDKVKIPVRQPLKSLKIRGADRLTSEFSDIIMEELNVKEILLEPGAELAVELDTRISPELEREGLARDLIRKINSYRKELKLTVNNRIVLFFKTSDEMVMKSFKEHEKNILDSVQADSVRFEKVKDSKVLKVNNADVLISVKVK